MPSYLDFDSTKNFRDHILGRTLKKPGGPQEFNSNNYVEKSTSDFNNKNLGGIIINQDTPGGTVNLYSPDEFILIEDTNTVRLSEVLDLYPYFEQGNHTLISIMSNSTYETESKLFRFAANNIKNNPDGPVLSRISRNIDKATNGRVRLLDALNGNTSTAINLITGREPLVDPNFQITVSKTLIGKAVDFLEVAAGVTTPFSQIPGDYLSNPQNPVNYRPEKKTEVGKLFQDVTGAIGSLFGIQRRPTRERKPSDLMIEYMGQGQKNKLYEMISYNAFGPNYTTTARSQNTSKVFNFIDKLAQGVKNIVGAEAPSSEAYIGDDRGNDVKFAMSDFNDRQYRSPYYLSLLFDQKSAELWNSPKYNRNLSEGGNLAGNLTWIQNKGGGTLGKNNPQYNSEKIEDTLSRNFEFEQKTLLAKTQEILSTGAGDRTHVSNVIDQTTRVFQDGDIKISRGSAIKYVNKFNSDESGVEYCRVWTKDRSYNNYEDTMKRTSNIRKFDGSILGGNSRPWNINIAPMSNGRKSFDDSTNIVERTRGSKDFYAKKYMFSIENLAWKTSNRAGFMVNDLPACEKGPNGGRVMWFPPYDLKVTEQNNANWDKNSFLGRPEPIYTYLDTERNGTVSFKVIVDHPSVLNLLVREHFKGMNDAEADNYINSFFAGCEEVDFYSLINTYTTLDRDDVNLIKQYLNSGSSKETIEKFKYTSVPQTVENPKPDPNKDNTNDSGDVNFKTTFYFENDFPKKNASDLSVAAETFGSLYSGYTSKKQTYLDKQTTDLITLTGATGPKNYEDQINIFSKSGVTLTNAITGGTISIASYTGQTYSGFTNFEAGFTKYTETLDKLRKDISGKTTQDVEIYLFSSTSEVASNEYNFYLGVRRLNSMVKDVLERIKNDLAKTPEFKWFEKTYLESKKSSGLVFNNETRKDFTFKELGYENEGTVKIFVSTQGEDVVLRDAGGQSNLDCTKVINDTSLKVTSPSAFFCRQGSVKVTYKNTVPGQQVPETSTTTVPKIKVDLDSQTVSNVRPKPSIDVMKRIIMKTLSECFYFKKLEDTDPFTFTSLKEKLKYFHPAFHSMTPEGLNARLTFLNQCLRPGDTIPVKGVSDIADLNARNTAFGPPPICVMRIGDFYHSKIIIRDIQITYEDSTWDLNPEGIGIQPMLANVTMQVVFLGGHGLEKPVEKLQNALSSNFYANTEIYDERSISTATTIGGKKAEDFTKEFLETLSKKPEYQLINDLQNPNQNVIQGQYIGTKSGNKLSYTSLVNSFYTSVSSYLNAYSTAYNTILKKYGNKLSNLLLNQSYRSVTGISINQSSSTSTIPPASGNTTSFGIFGQYPKTKELATLVKSVSDVMKTTLDQTSFTDIIFDIFQTSDSRYQISEDTIHEWVKSETISLIDGIVEDTSYKELETARNTMIKIIDKLNFLVHYQYDAQISGETYTNVTLSGFTGATLYNEYKNVVSYLNTNYSQFTTDMNYDIVSVTQFNTDEIKEIMKSVLLGKKDDFVSLYAREPLFSADDIAYVSIMYDAAVGTPISGKTFDLGRTPIRTNTKEIEFELGTEQELTDDVAGGEVNKLFIEKSNLGSTLNYYIP